MAAPPEQPPAAPQDDQEPFEIFSEAGKPLGLAPRGRVHAEGLWHRSAQVYLFDAAGRLYLQRRPASKDVCPGLWDQSVAEHLMPGESYRQAARRGLREELGVSGVALEELGGVFRGTLDQPEQGIHDHELQQSFRGVWHGPLRPHPVEVAEVRAVTLARLEAWVRASPEAFTPWFLRDAARLGILAGPDQPA